MKKCVDAIRYGIETLGVTPDQMFELISSSREYDGEVYDRWLASKIIEVSEKDGVGFSQILVKKFEILSELASANDGGIGDEYLNFFKSKLGDPYTVGFNSYTEKFNEEKFLDDVNWSEGIDFGQENLFFLNSDNGFSEDCVKDVVDRRATFLINIVNGDYNRKSEVVSDAKRRGLSIDSFGDLLLYRMCLLSEVFSLGTGRVVFGFLCPSRYLYESAMVSEVVRHFYVEGWSIPNLNIYSGEYAFCLCYDRPSEKDYVELGSLETRDDVIVEHNDIKRVFSYSSSRMLDSLKSRKYVMDATTFLERDGKLVGTADGVKGAYGYMGVGKGNRFCLDLYSVVPDGYDMVIPIKDNLFEIIAYYSLVSSNRENGMPVDINVLLTGYRDYCKLVYNALPLFLYDWGSHFKGYKYEKNGEEVLKRNKLDVLNTSSQSHELYEQSEVYFSFEAKEVMFVVSEYKKRVSEDVWSICSLEEVRGIVGDSLLDRRYADALRRLKEYLSSEYRAVYRR